MIGAGGKIGLGIAQTRSGNAVLVTGLAPDGTAHQSGEIKVGDELLFVDGVSVRDRDIPAICAQIADGPDLHVTLTFACAPSKNEGKKTSPQNKGAAPKVKPPSPYSVVLPRYVHVYVYVYIYMYVCIYMFVFVYVYVYVCMYMYMYVCMYACMYICMYVCMYVCIYGMYVCIYI